MLYMELHLVSTSVMSMSFLVIPSLSLIARNCSQARLLWLMSVTSAETFFSSSGQTLRTSVMQWWRT